MTIRRSKSNIGALALVLIGSLAMPCFAEPRSDSNSERIEKLEAAVSSLENRISVLEGKSAAQVKPQPDSPFATDAWERRANWRLLSKGMTKEKVRSILGEPESVEASGPFELWRWGGSFGPKVTLYDERVYGWEEPSH